MSGRRMSRGRLLRRAGLTAGAFAAAPLLAACGEVTSRSAAPVGSTDWWGGQHDTGQLVFANWPLYIDYTNWLKDRPSLNGFSRHTGHRGHLRRGHRGQRAVLPEDRADGSRQGSRWATT